MSRQIKSNSGFTQSLWCQDWRWRRRRYQTDSNVKILWFISLVKPCEYQISQAFAAWLFSWYNWISFKARINHKLILNYNQNSGFARITETWLDNTTGIQMDIYCLFWGNIKSVCYSGIVTVFVIILFLNFRFGHSWRNVFDFRVF